MGCSVCGLRASAGKREHQHQQHTPNLQTPHPTAINLNGVIFAPVIGAPAPPDLARPFARTVHVPLVHPPPPRAKSSAASGSHAHILTRERCEHCSSVALHPCPRLARPALHYRRHALRQCASPPFGHTQYSTIHYYIHYYTLEYTRIYYDTLNTL